LKSKAYIGLGSNLGDRLGNLKSAVNAISQLDKTRVLKQSRIYETEPVGYLDQGNFLNMVLLIETELKPIDLLKKLQGIESMLKRERIIRWGPRTIDLDILIYDDVIINLPELTIPHPEMLKRAFVLIPMKDIDPHMEINGINIDRYISKCDDKNGVKLYPAE